LNVLQSNLSSKLSFLSEKFDLASCSNGLGIVNGAKMDDRGSEEEY
jgi:hypothetical protein